MADFNRAFGGDNLVQRIIDDIGINNFHSIESNYDVSGSQLDPEYKITFDVKEALTKYRDEALIVQNYILRRILEEADSRSLPYQIHTGMTNLSQSNPAQLESMIQQYRNISFVLLHAYPFISEASYLARTNPNVWVDTSWLVLQSPEILQIALKEYIGMVPADRIFSSIDSISLEEYTGGIALTRSVLIDVLSEKVESNFLDIEEALYISERVLGGNCEQLHRL